MIRVIDLTHYVAGPFATMLLAEMGCEVIKVEPLTGDPWRRRQDGPDKFSFGYLNKGKRSIALDLKTPIGKSLLGNLLSNADAIVESFRPGVLSAMGFSWRALKRANKRLILTSITNFGQDGSYSSWKATEIVLQAMGGIVASTGWKDEAPLKLAGYIACELAGVSAATSTLAATLGVRRKTAPPVHIDVSIQETFAPHWSRHISRYAYAGIDSSRPARDQPGPQGFPLMLEASDGPLYVQALGAEWEPFAFFLGLEEFITHEWSDVESRAARYAELEPKFRAAIASRGRYEWFAAAAERGYTFAPVQSTSDLLRSPQLRERGFIVKSPDPSTEDPIFPRVPFRTSTDTSPVKRAPALGADTVEILSHLIGMSQHEIESLVRLEVVGA